MRTLYRFPFLLLLSFIFHGNVSSLRAQDVIDTAAAHHDHMQARKMLTETWRDSAEIYLYRAFKGFALAGCHERKIHMTTLRARNFLSMGLSDTALSLFHQALADGRKAEVDKWNPYIYTRLGELFRQTGDYIQSLHYLDSASSFYQQKNMERSIGMADNLSAYGLVFISTGQIQEAKYYLLKSNLILEELDKTVDLRYFNNLFRLGNVYGSLGDFQKSKQTLDRLAQKSYGKFRPDHPFNITLRHDYAVLFKMMGKHDTALLLFEMNIPHLEKYKNYELLSKSLNNLGQILIWKGDFASAKARLKTCLTIPNIRQNISICPTTFDLLGQASYQAGEFITGISYYDSILGLFIKKYDPSIRTWPKHLPSRLSEEIIRAYAGKTDGLFKAYLANHDTAYLFSAYKGCRYIEQLLSRIPIELHEEDTRQQWSDEFGQAYPLMLSVFTKVQQVSPETVTVEDFFRISEKGRSSLLLAALKQDHAIHFANIPDSILNLGKSLKDKIRYLDLQASQLEEQPQLSSQDSMTFLRVNDGLLRAKEDYGRHIQHLENRYPAYNEMIYQTRLANMELLQRALRGSNTAIIEYYLADPTIYIFLIQENGIFFLEQPIDSTFFKNLNRFMSSIRKMRDEAFASSSHALYQSLLAPIDDKLGNVHKLLIIPSGLLSYLPFEALLTNSPVYRGEVLNMQDQPYLIRDYDISYHLSASLWYLQKSTSRLNTQQGFLGFAPVFSPGDPSSESMNPDLNMYDSIPGLSFIRHTAFRGKQFQELKYSFEEVNDIGALFSQHKQPVTLNLHHHATEFAFHQDASAHKYIHIASHSFINDKKPSLSGIAFSQHGADSTNPKNDGVLFSGEIFGLNLNADLLVMSSCESGLGQMNKGEGLMTMSRAFLYAGCSNILYSLWKVYDRPTRDLMYHFYKELLNGDDYAHALRKAKLSLIGDSTSSFPRMWSGFVHIGP